MNCTSSVKSYILRYNVINEKIHNQNSVVLFSHFAFFFFPVRHDPVCGHYVAVPIKCFCYCCYYYFFSQFIIHVAHCNARCKARKWSKGSVLKRMKATKTIAWTSFVNLLTLFQLYFRQPSPSISAHSVCSGYVYVGA